MIDLRSDTVTRPTPEMRRAMMEAEVGDDVYGEDLRSTIWSSARLRLPARNRAVRAHRHHGKHHRGQVADEHGQGSDLRFAGAPAGLRTLDGRLVFGLRDSRIQTGDGILSWDEVRRQIRPLNPYSAPTGLLLWKHATCTGERYTRCAWCAKSATGPLIGAWKFTWMARASQMRRRLLGMPVQELAAPADTVMFCLSKALGAPAGSILAGPAGLIAKAGSTANAWAAACGRWGAGGRRPDRHGRQPRKLHDDHGNARFLAEGLARIPGFR